MCEQAANANWVWQGKMKDGFPYPYKFALAAILLFGLYCHLTALGGVGRLTPNFIFLVWESNWEAQLGDLSAIVGCFENWSWRRTSPMEYRPANIPAKSCVLTLFSLSSFFFSPHPTPLSFSFLALIHLYLSFFSLPLYPSLGCLSVGFHSVTSLSFSTLSTLSLCFLFFFSPSLFWQRSSGSELQEIMRRRQEKLAAVASDSGVESFDESSSHWAANSPATSYPTKTKKNKTKKKKTEKRFTLLHCRFPGRLWARPVRRDHAQTPESPGSRTLPISQLRHRVISEGRKEGECGILGNVVFDYRTLWLPHWQSISEITIRTNA